MSFCNVCNKSVSSLDRTTDIGTWLDDHKHNPEWAEVTLDHLILKANPNGGSDVVRNSSGKKRQSGEQPYMLELR